MGGRRERADERGEQKGEGSLHKGIDTKARQVFEDISAAAERTCLTDGDRLGVELLTRVGQQIVQKINLRGARGLSLLWAHD